MMITDQAGLFAAVLGTLYAGHQVADHWVQTSGQAGGKGRAGWPGRLSCAAHVATLTVTLALMLAVLAAVTHLGIHPAPAVIGLAVNAVSHYWADRRFTLARLASRLRQGEFYRLGTPRPGKDDNPSLGTGAYALDQSWHVAWLWIAALIITI